MIKRFSISVIAFSAAGFWAIVAPSPLRAAEPANMNVLLERTGQRVKQFWDELSSVACTENLVQQKFDEKGKLILNSKGNFDYLINLRFDSGGMLVDESRLPLDPPARRAPQGALLATQGFATLLLILHPGFQNSYAFSQEGEETSGGRPMVRVRFLPRTGSASPAILALKGRNYPIAWEGTAFIDPETAMVTNVEARWKDPAEEIGIVSLTSHVFYAPTSFRGTSRGMWLPETAEIDVRTLHQHWKNVHHFSNYRLFAVDADSKIGDVKQ